MKYFALLLCVGVICSCANNTNETNETEPVNEDTTVTVAPAVDSVVSELETHELDIAVLVQKGVNQKLMPFSLDSAEISEIENSEIKDTLYSEEVKELAKFLIENELNEYLMYDVNSFILIDSLKKNGGYEAYEQTIDIGMILYAEAYAHYRLELDDNHFIMVWSIYTGSYEACPYYSGTKVFGTLFVNNLATSTTLIGESSGGADAPVFSETAVVSEITAGSIEIFKKEIYGEESEDGTEDLTIDTSMFVINIHEDQFEFKK